MSGPKLNSKPQRDSLMNLTSNERFKYKLYMSLLKDNKIFSSHRPKDPEDNDFHIYPDDPPEVVTRKLGMSFQYIKEQKKLHTDFDFAADFTELVRKKNGNRTEVVQWFQDDEIKGLPLSKNPYEFVSYDRVRDVNFDSLVFKEVQQDLKKMNKAMADPINALMNWDSTLATQVTMTKAQMKRELASQLEAEPPKEDTDAPTYWNAENDFIRLATLFFKFSGDDPGTAEKDMIADFEDLNRCPADYLVYPGGGGLDSVDREISQMNADNLKTTIDSFLGTKLEDVTGRETVQKYVYYGLTLLSKNENMQANRIASGESPISMETRNAVFKRVKDTLRHSLEEFKEIRLAPGSIDEKFSGNVVADVLAAQGAEAMNYCQWASSLLRSLNALSSNTQVHRGRAFINRLDDAQTDLKNFMDEHMDGDYLKLVDENGLPRMEEYKKDLSALWEALEKKASELSRKQQELLSWEKRMDECIVKHDNLADEKEDLERQILEHANMSSDASKIIEAATDALKQVSDEYEKIEQQRAAEDDRLSKNLSAEARELLSEYQHAPLNLRNSKEAAIIEWAEKNGVDFNKDLAVKLRTLKQGLDEWEKAAELLGGINEDKTTLRHDIPKQLAELETLAPDDGLERELHDINEQLRKAALEEQKLVEVMAAMDTSKKKIGSDEPTLPTPEAFKRIIANLKDAHGGTLQFDAESFPLANYEEQRRSLRELLMQSKTLGDRRVAEGQSKVAELEKTSKKLESKIAKQQKAADKEKDALNQITTLLSQNMNDASARQKLEANLMEQGAKVLPLTNALAESRKKADSISTSLQNFKQLSWIHKSLAEFGLGKRFNSLMVDQGALNAQFEKTSENFKTLNSSFQDDMVRVTLEHQQNPYREPSKYLSEQVSKKKAELENLTKNWEDLKDRLEKNRINYEQNMEFFDYRRTKVETLNAEIDIDAAEYLHMKSVCFMKRDILMRDIPAMENKYAEVYEAFQGFKATLANGEGSTLSAFNTHADFSRSYASFFIKNLSNDLKSKYDNSHLYKHSGLMSDSSEYKDMINALADLLGEKRKNGKGVQIGEKPQSGFLKGDDLAGCTDKLNDLLQKTRAYLKAKHDQSTSASSQLRKGRLLYALQLQNICKSALAQLNGYPHPNDPRKNCPGLAENITKFMKVATDAVTKDAKGVHFCVNQVDTQIGKMEQEQKNKGIAEPRVDAAAAAKKVFTEKVMPLYIYENHTAIYEKGYDKWKIPPLPEKAKAAEKSAEKAPKNAEIKKEIPAAKKGGIKMCK